jgi:hypothetical protein
MTPAEKAFRQLREHWFVHHLQSQPHERVWESDADEALREQRNTAMKVKFDEDTEAILRGEDRFVSPRYMAHLGTSNYPQPH